VRCSGLEHKMGIHASPTCVLDFEDAEAWLVGEPHKGMRGMFTMMNGARLMVGMEGVALSEIAYQTALAFAQERRQSRSLDPAKRETNERADNILVHPDVRRMLLTIKSTTEAMRGLCTWAAVELDLSHHHPDEQRRQEADDLIGLLTPIIKAYCTDRGFLNTSEAMQVCGGAGYTRDWSIEQYLRDVRIGGIYEGTNHVQALDLVGRKLPRYGGRALNVFGGRVGKLVAAQQGNERMAPLTKALEASMARLMAVTGELAAKGMADAEHAAAVASSYLHLFALTALGYSWCVQVAHAIEGDDDALTERKLKTARFFFELLLPEQLALEAVIGAGKAPMMDLAVDEL